MSTGALLIGLAEIWLYIGAIVAVAFLMFGIGRIDEDARGSYTFRPLLVAGVLLIWPIVLWRWISAELIGLDAVVSRDKPLRDAHRRVWIVLAVLIPLIFIVSLAVRQITPEPGRTAVQINPTAE
jgi:hypothetical protein